MINRLLKYLYRALLKPYENSELVIRKKVKAFLFILITLLIFNSIYILIHMFNDSPFTQDLKILFSVYLFILISFVLFQQGHFYWAVNTAFMTMLIPLSIIVYYGETLNELKMYNMAFLHTLALSFGFFVAQRKSQVFFMGGWSLSICSLFLFTRLLPNSEGNNAGYWTSYRN